MSDQTLYPRIQTFGPADDKAPLAQKFYAGLTAVSGLVGLASALGMITGEQAASLGQVSTTGTAFVAALGLAIASFRTKKQINNGTFEAVEVQPVVVPELPAVPALEQIRILRDAASHELTRGQENAAKAAAVITGVLNGIPVVGGTLSGAVSGGVDAAEDLLGRFR